MYRARDTKLKREVANRERGPLLRVSAAGGEPMPVTKLQPGERSHRMPSFLPDGRHFTFIPEGTTEIFLGSLDSEETKRLQSADSDAVYAPPGYLLFVRQGTLLAQVFDARKLELAGEPFSIAERVASDPTNGRPLSRSRTTACSRIDRARRLVVTRCNSPGSIVRGTRLN